jgi:rare lipoprotein A (peptidoglycan hydrolase)
MRKVIPLEKMSKKKRKEYHAKQRGSWYGMSPVTRVVPSGKTYDRSRMKQAARSGRGEDLF